ncbi:MAG: class II glutamine amidotransferase, partial [Candidatus Binatia bacterium]
MCELFAMSSRIPADVTFSLHEFARHGGATGPHEDGWGIAFYEDGDAQLFREPAAAADSALVRFIEKSPPGSDLVISHIRRAVRGSRVLKNTQPFARELGGRVHLFAHNGMLDAVEDSPDLTLGEFRPVGVTDSEYAFCTLLEMLRELWSTGEPSLDERLAVVGDFAARIRPLGPANFIYCDGTAIFVHGHRRIQSDAE